MTATREQKAAWFSEGYYSAIREYQKGDAICCGKPFEQVVRSNISELYQKGNTENEYFIYCCGALKYIEEIGK
jgi:hypothetical protein